MRNLFHFIARFHFTILFLMFEMLCIILLVRYNNFQQSTMLNSGNYICGMVYDNVSAITQYIHLKETNQALNKENSYLRGLLKQSHQLVADSTYVFNDSLYQQKYLYRSAKIINNSINKQNNYITLNKGRKNGIKPEMGVIANGGIVGVVVSVSDHYASVLSLLNSRLRISAKIKKNNYFGSLTWDGKDYRKAKLKEIPFNALVQKGDTIVTSGFSEIFPEGILVGVVNDISDESESNFHNINVLLFNDFKQLSYVQVIDNLMRNEEKENRKE